MSADIQTSPGIGLAEAIGLIRSELQRAAQAGEGARLAFKPTAVEVEFEVAFSQAAGVEGGIKVWVLSLGAKGEQSTSHTQRLTVTFEPVDRATGRSPEISDVGPK